MTNKIKTKDKQKQNKNKPQHNAEHYKDEQPRTPQKHNTENYKDELHEPHKNTTQKITKMSYTDPTKTQHRKL